MTALGLTQPPKSDVYPLADRPLLSSGSQYRYLTIIGDGRVARSFPPLQQGDRSCSPFHVRIKVVIGFRTTLNVIQIYLFPNLPSQPSWRGQCSPIPPSRPTCPQGKGAQTRGGGTRSQFVGLPRCHHHYHRHHGRHCRVPCGECRVCARGGNNHRGVRSEFNDADARFCLLMCFRWFGLILLPLISFAADGAVATVCRPSPSLKFVPF